jgi:hypothetical protein
VAGPGYAQGSFRRPVRRPALDVLVCAIVGYRFPQAAMIHLFPFAQWGRVDVLAQDQRPVTLDLTPVA